IRALDSSEEEPSRNLFLDVMGLPTVLYWDHVLTQAARYVIDSWPRSPAESKSGVIPALKALLTHPNAINFFPDSGHAAEIEKLGLLSCEHDPFFVTAVSQVFVQHGLEEHGSAVQGEELAFFGNIYLSASEQIPYNGRPALMKIRETALSRCEAN